MGVNVAALVRAGRTMASGAFLDAATVADPVMVPDGHGGQAASYVARAEPVRVSLVQVKDGPLIDDGGILQGPALVVALAPYGTDLPDGSRVTVLGASYEVVGRTSAESERTVIERYTLREVR